MSLRSDIELPTDDKLVAKGLLLDKVHEVDQSNPFIRWVEGYLDTEERSMVEGLISCGNHDGSPSGCRA